MSLKGPEAERYGVVPALNLSHAREMGREEGDGRNEKHTSADASGSPETGPEVALEPLGVVAGLRLAAVFIELPCTHFAAPAGVRHQADPRCTFGQLQGTLALLWACAESLLLWGRQRHGHGHK